MIPSAPMPARDESSAQSHRKSWSARFRPRETAMIERGCATTHCGLASRFVERAFLDFAAEQGALFVDDGAPLVIAETPQKTLENIILVQGALFRRLTPGGRRSTTTFVARSATLSWFIQYLVAGVARADRLPPTPLPGPLPNPLNLPLLPIHLDLLGTMAGDDMSKVDVLSAALHRQAENLGLEDVDFVDEYGVPRLWTTYPHPELLTITNTLEDTLLALLVAYRSLAPLKATPEWVASSSALMSEITRIKLSKMSDE